MNWKRQLIQVEHSIGTDNLQYLEDGDIELFQSIIANHPNDHEAYIRIIYIIHDFLVEGITTTDEHDFLATLLKKYFEDSYKKFSENTEYLFFIGKILYIAEWYFGLDDDPKPIQMSLAFQMQKKALDKEPHNILFEWAYVFSKDDKPKAFLLADQLLHHDIYYLAWLKRKGFAGHSVLDSIQYCYNTYGKIINPD